jgi:nitrite reductase (NO-forming)
MDTLILTGDHLEPQLKGKMQRLKRVRNDYGTRNLQKAPWLVRNVQWIKSFIRIILGVVWLIDGSFKFAPGFVDSFPNLITRAGTGQPVWLQPWFNFWYNATVANPGPFVYAIGSIELLLGAALVLGFMRKIAYVGGIILSLMIWAVPEGFGGPYGAGSTDIGTGIIYSFVFLSLLAISAAYGPSRYSVDRLIETKWASWQKIAETNGNRPETLERTD